MFRFCEILFRFMIIEVIFSQTYFFHLWFSQSPEKLPLRFSPFFQKHIEVLDKISDFSREYALFAMQMQHRNHYIVF